MPPSTSAVPADPFADGIAAFARRLRRGETTVEQSVADCLARIAALEPRIGAFEHVAADSALAAARALDGLLASGTDLGPLMGVPVALKDLIAVRGMPTTCGSALDASDIVGPEGAFVGRLRRAGCVVLGKAKTIEFAFGGAGGVNAVRGTPWNPWDPARHRGCGGSSSGSAAAVAAGFAGFAIGSDTGGSVRLPGAFCGLYGLKPSHGTWPLDGVFPLCPTLDTLGPLTRSAADAALVLEALGDVPPVAPATLEGLRLGVPTNQFVDETDPDVASAFEAALAGLRVAGARIDPVTVPEAGPPEAFFHAIVPAEFLAAFGRERFLRDRDRLGPDIAKRAEAGLDLAADTYIGFVRRHRALAGQAAAAFAGFDAWITPTVGFLAPPVDAFDDVEAGLALNVRIGRYTRPVNIYGLCAATLPIRGPDARLPIGLQLIAPAGGDAALLALSMAVESHLGAPRLPDTAPFLEARDA